MDNLLRLIAIAVVYLCVVLRSDKKRRAGKAHGEEKKASPRRSGGRRSRERRASFAQAFDSGAQDAGAGTGSAPARPAGDAVRGPGALAADAEDAAFPEEDCEAHAPGLHLHAVTQERLRTAGEGEDPCHAGGAVRPAAQREPVPDDAEHAQDNEAARELLRGVILSEILERPCARRERLQHRRRI